MNQIILALFTCLVNIIYDTKEPVQAYKYLNSAIKAHRNQPDFTRDEFYYETENIGNTYALLGNIFYYFFDKIKYRFGDLEDEEIGNELDKLSNFNIARDKYEKAIREGYESSEVHYNLGRIYYMNKEYNKSLKQWLHLYEDFVEHPELMFSLGNSFYHIGNFGASKGEYLKIISVFEFEADKINVILPGDTRHIKIFQTLGFSI